MYIQNEVEKGDFSPLSQHSRGMIHRVSIHKFHPKIQEELKQAVLSRHSAGSFHYFIEMLAKCLQRYPFPLHSYEITGVGEE